MLRLEGLPGDVRSPRGLNEQQLRRLRQREAEIARVVYRRQHDLLSELLTLDLDWQLAESLLQKADVAMYVAKRAGRGLVHVAHEATERAARSLTG